jgi:hypothetical protein
VPPGATQTLSANRAPIKIEWSLILAACSAVPPSEKTERLRRLLREPIRWPEVMELADQHGVQTQVSQSILSVRDSVPAAVAESFRQSYQNNLHKTLLLSGKLIEILDCLASVRIDAIPYKGLALAQVLYGDVAQRQAGDIDLLIRARDLSRIREVLRQLGYTPHMSLRGPEERAYLRSGYELSFDGKSGPNLLEVQWAIQPRFYAFDFDMEALFERVVIIEVAGCPMKTLGSNDLLLVLCAHAAKHGWGRLVWLCDIAGLVPSPSLDWSWISAEANRLGVARIVQTTFLLASKLLELKLPPQAMTLFPGSEAYRLAEETYTNIADPRTADVESLSYFRLMLRLRERRADQLKFLSRLILTPGPGEWNAIRLPSALFPLYHVVRLFRLTARIARP